MGRTLVCTEKSALQFGQISSTVASNPLVTINLALVTIPILFLTEKDKDVQSFTFGIMLIFDTESEFGAIVAIGICIFEKMSLSKKIQCGSPLFIIIF